MENINGDQVFDLRDQERVIIPKGIEIISSNSFSECKNLDRVDIPCTVRVIRNGAFEECPNLRSVYFHGPGLEVIGAYAFAGCNKLLGIRLHSSVVEIKDYAFAGCNSLIFLSYPSSARVADTAFKNENGTKIAKRCTFITK